MTLRGGGGGPRLNVIMMLIFLKNSLEVSPYNGKRKFATFNQVAAATAVYP